MIEIQIKLLILDLEGNIQDFLRLLHIVTKVSENISKLNNLFKESTRQFKKNNTVTAIERRHPSIHTIHTMHTTSYLWHGASWGITSTPWPFHSYWYCVSCIHAIHKLIEIERIHWWLVNAQVNASTKPLRKLWVRYSPNHRIRSQLNMANVEMVKRQQWILT